MKLGVLFLQLNVLLQVCCSYFTIVIVLGYRHTMSAGLQITCLLVCTSLDQEEPYLEKKNRDVQ